MQFELTSALIDDILFHMEDQSGIFVLDVREGMVVNTDDDIREFDDDDDDNNYDDSERYISLPEWDSSDGFRLMERFTATLRNALVREELSAALDRGRGVFRAFKNTLSRYPEIEKLWYAYKDREMKRSVVSWYNALRESWGLELIGEEPEDIAGLAQEDFRFRTAVDTDRAFAQELHKACLGEQSMHAAVSAGQDMSAECLFGADKWVFPGDMGFIVETAGGEFAGYICAARLPDKSLRICAIEVRLEYRGLGLGKALVAQLLEQAENEKIPCVSVDLPAGQEHFSRALLREDFKPCIQRFCRIISSKGSINI